MVGIKGLGEVPEPKPDRPAKVREQKARDAAKAEIPKDDVLISSAAEAAATIARVVQDVKIDPGVRADKVVAAQEHIARGDYKRPEVVAKVAERISKYLP